MKTIAAIVIMAVAVSCSQKQGRESLPGSFKYLSYYWNNSKDSVGLSLAHYIDVARDGNYNLILRINPDSTAYYYGFVGDSVLRSLRQFMLDSTAYKRDYLPADTASRTLRYRFDYADSTETNTITFTPGSAPGAVAEVQLALDSVIAGPGKKRGHAFNIDAYLRKLIARDSAL